MIAIENEAATQTFGQRLGGLLRGGEVIELIGDVGAGKTTLVRGIAKGMGVDETVQSPSFTINRVYDAADGKLLVHYDFYRLENAGIMADELADTLQDKKAVIIIEWASAVAHVLPDDHLSIAITTPSETTRKMEITAGGAVSQSIAEQLA